MPLGHINSLTATQVPFAKSLPISVSWSHGFLRQFRTSGFTLKPLTHLGLIFVRSKRSVCTVPLIYTWISGFSRTIFWRGLSFNYFNFKLAYRVTGFIVESSYISVNVLRSRLFPSPVVSLPLPTSSLPPLLWSFFYFCDLHINIQIHFLFRFTYDIQHAVFEYGSFHFDVRESFSTLWRCVSTKAPSEGSNKELNGQQLGWRG